MSRWHCQSCKPLALSTVRVFVDSSPISPFLVHTARLFPEVPRPLSPHLGSSVACPVLDPVLCPDCPFRDTRHGMRLGPLDCHRIGSRSQRGPCRGWGEDMRLRSVGPYQNSAQSPTQTLRAVACLNPFDRTSGCVDSAVKTYLCSMLQFHTWANG